MLNVAYCRVSTKEQAAEGFSIDGQAEKLCASAELHDLGPVMLVEDPGCSGRTWSGPAFSSSSRCGAGGTSPTCSCGGWIACPANLGDLILLAHTFGKNDVGLHPFTDKIDLSSATGRMFYNILGDFAQFHREQLAENVRLGMQQAAREGRWVNRPKMGYDLIDGHLVRNAEAPTVQRMFALSCRRAQLPGDRGANRREVLNGPGQPALQDRHDQEQGRQDEQAMTTELMMFIRDSRIRRDQAG